MNNIAKVTIYLTLTLFYSLIICVQSLDPSRNRPIRDDEPLLMDFCELIYGNHSLDSINPLQIIETHFAKEIQDKEMYMKRYTDYTENVKICDEIKNYLTLSSAFIHKIQSLYFMEPIIDLGKTIDWIYQHIYEMQIQYTEWIENPQMDEARQLVLKFNMEPSINELIKLKNTYNAKYEEKILFCSYYRNSTKTERSNVADQLNAIEIFVDNLFFEFTQIVQENMFTDAQLKVVDQLNDNMKNGIDLITNATIKFNKIASQLFVHLYSENIKYFQNIPIVEIGFNINNYLNKLYPLKIEIDQLDIFVENNITYHKTNAYKNIEYYYKLNADAYSMYRNFTGHLKNDRPLQNLLMYADNIMASLGIITSISILDIDEDIAFHRGQLLYVGEILNSFKNMKDNYQNINSIKMQYLEELKHLAQTVGYSEKLLENHYIYEDALGRFRRLESYLLDEEYHNFIHNQTTQFINQMNELNIKIKTMGIKLQKNIDTVVDNNLSLQNQMDSIGEIIYKENEAYLDEKIPLKYDNKDTLEMIANINLIVEKIYAQTNKFNDVNTKKNYLLNNHQLVYTTLLLQKYNITKQIECSPPFSINMLNSLAFTNKNLIYIPLEDKLTKFSLEFYADELDLTKIENILTELTSDVKIFTSINTHPPTKFQIQETRNLLSSHLNSHPREFHAVVDSSAMKLFSFKYSGMILENDRFEQANRNSEILETNLKSIDDRLKFLNFTIETVSVDLNKSREYLNDYLIQLYHLNDTYTHALQQLVNIKQLVTVHKTRLMNQSLVLDEKLDHILTEIQFDYQPISNYFQQIFPFQNELLESIIDINTHIESIAELYKRFYGIDYLMELTKIYEDISQNKLNYHIEKYSTYVSKLDEERNNFKTEFSQYKLKLHQLYRNTMVLLTATDEQASYCQSNIALTTDIETGEEILKKCDNLVTYYNITEMEINRAHSEVDSMLKEIEKFKNNQERQVNLPSAGNTEINDIINRSKNHIDFRLQQKHPNIGYDNEKSAFLHTRFTQLYEFIEDRNNILKNKKSKSIDFNQHNPIVIIFKNLTKEASESIYKFHMFKNSYIKRGVELWDVDQYNLTNFDYFYSIINNNASLNMSYINIDNSYNRLFAIPTKLNTLSKQCHNIFNSMKQHYYSYKTANNNIVELMQNQTITGALYEHKLQKLIKDRDFSIQSVFDSSKGFLKNMFRHQYYYSYFDKLYNNKNLELEVLNEQFVSLFDHTPTKLQESIYSDKVLHLEKQLKLTSELNKMYNVLQTLKSDYRLQLLNTFKNSTIIAIVNRQNFTTNFQHVYKSIINLKDQLLIDAISNQNQCAFKNWIFTPELQNNLENFNKFVMTFHKELLNLIKVYENKFNSKQTEIRKIYQTFNQNFDIDNEKTLNNLRLLECCNRMLKGYECRYTIVESPSKSKCNKIISQLSSESFDLHHIQLIYQDIINEFYVSTHTFNTEHETREINRLKNSLSTIQQSYNEFKKLYIAHCKKSQNELRIANLKNDLYNVNNYNEKFVDKYLRNLKKFESFNRTIIEEFINFISKIEPQYPNCEIKKNYIQNLTNTAVQQTNYIINLIPNQAIQQSLDTHPTVVHIFKQHYNEITQSCNELSKFVEKFKSLENNLLDIISYKEQLDTRYKQSEVIYYKIYKQLNNYTDLIDSEKVDNINYEELELGLDDISITISRQNITIKRMSIDMRQLEEDIKFFRVQMKKQKTTVKTQINLVIDNFKNYTNNAEKLWLKLTQVKSLALKLKVRSKKLMTFAENIELDFETVKTLMEKTHIHLSTKLEQITNKTNIDLNKLEIIKINFYDFFYNQTVDLTKNIEKFSYQIPTHLQTKYQILIKKYQNFTRYHHITTENIRQFYHQQRIYYNTEFQKYRNHVENLLDEKNSILNFINGTHETLFDVRNEIDLPNIVDHKIEQVDRQITMFLKEIALFDPSIQDYLQHLPDDMFVIDVEFSNSLSEYVNLLKNILITLESIPNKPNVANDDVGVEKINQNDSVLSNKSITITHEEGPNKQIDKQDDKQHHSGINTNQKIWTSVIIIVALICGTVLVAVFFKYRQRKIGERELYIRCNQIYNSSPKTL